MTLLRQGKPWRHSMTSARRVKYATSGRPISRNGRLSMPIGLSGLSIRLGSPRRRITIACCIVTRSWKSYRRVSIAALASCLATGGSPGTCCHVTDQRKDDPSGSSPIRRARPNTRVKITDLIPECLVTADPQLIRDQKLASVRTALAGQRVTSYKQRARPRGGLISGSAVLCEPDTSRH
jgi:hypothetical protein